MRLAHAARSGAGRKSSADSSTPLSFAAAISAGTCLNGMVPPVPPASLGRAQLETRVRWTPAISATALGPPSFRMMLCAGSIRETVAIVATIASKKCSDYRVTAFRASRL